jgi:hypothetical protein
LGDRLKVLLDDDDSYVRGVLQFELAKKGNAVEAALEEFMP